MCVELVGRKMKASAAWSQVAGSAASVSHVYLSRMEEMSTKDSELVLSHS